LPEISLAQWPTNKLKLCLDEMQLWHRRFTGSELETAFLSILAYLTQSWAERVPLDLPKFTTGSNCDVSEIFSLVEFALKSGGKAPCGAILERVVDSELISEGYCRHLLLPLIPSIRSTAYANDFRVSEAPFSVTICLILQFWVENVLGPEPVYPEGIETSFGAWKCGCSDCNDARSFLLDRTALTQSLLMEKIGKVRGEYIGKHINADARGFAVYEKQSPGPPLSIKARLEVYSHKP
jgi:hypothetical protein